MKTLNVPEDWREKRGFNVFAAAYLDRVTPMGKNTYWDQTKQGFLWALKWIVPWAFLIKMIQWATFDKPFELSPYFWIPVYMLIWGVFELLVMTVGRRCFKSDTSSLLKEKH